MNNICMTIKHISLYLLCVCILKHVCLCFIVDVLPMIYADFNKNHCVWTRMILVGCYATLCQWDSAGLTAESSKDLQIHKTGPVEKNFDTMTPSEYLHRNRISCSFIHHVIYRCYRIHHNWGPFKKKVIIIIQKNMLC